MPREYYTFNFIPKFKEMVKIMDDTEKEECLNNCRAVQKDMLDVFISEGIFKQGRILQFQTLVKPRRVFLLPTCNCETCEDSEIDLELGWIKKNRFGDCWYLEDEPVITVDFTHNAYCIQMIQKCLKNENAGKKERKMEKTNK